MNTDGVGWTVIQRRKDGSVDFYRDWAEYKNGFGSLTGEFWLGNDKIYRLTASGNTVLRVDPEDWSENRAYARYGSYSGTAGDSLAYHNGSYFTTKDKDNDWDDGNCTQTWHGAWWYN